MFLRSKDQISSFPIRSFETNPKNIEKVSGFVNFCQLKINMTHQGIEP